MAYKDRFFSLLVLALLGGCSSLMEDTKAASKSDVSPPLNTRSLITIGGPIFTQFDSKESDSIVLTEDAVQGFMVGGFRATAGEPLLAKGGGEYCTTHRIYIDPLMGPYSNMCFKDRDGDGAFDRGRLASAFFGSDLNAPIKFSKKTATPTGAAFRKELLYQGTDGNTLQVTYREFNSDLTRPAFTQNLSFPMSEGTTENRFSKRGNYCLQSQFK